MTVDSRSDREHSAGDCETGSRANSQPNSPQTSTPKPRVKFMDDTGQSRAESSVSERTKLGQSGGTKLADDKSLPASQTRRDSQATARLRKRESPNESSSGKSAEKPANKRAKARHGPNHKRRLRKIGLSQSDVDHLHVHESPTLTFNSKLLATKHKFLRQKSLKFYSKNDIKYIQVCAGLTNIAALGAAEKLENHQPERADQAQGHLQAGCQAKASQRADQQTLSAQHQAQATRRHEDRAILQEVRFLGVEPKKIQCQEHWHRPLVHRRVLVVSARCWRPSRRRKAIYFPAD